MTPPSVSRNRVASRAVKLSQGGLSKALTRCGYSEATAVAAADVFKTVIEALYENGFPNLPPEADSLNALREIKRIAAGFT